MKSAVLLLLLLGPGASVAAAPDAGAVEPVIVAPVASCSGSPVYPPSEKSSGVRGSVVLRVTLSETGAVTALEVATGIGPAFDQAALDSAKGCTFSGATRDGTPVPAIIELSVEFIPPVQPWILDGKVVGELGEALAGAEVRYGGKGATTDAEGRFHLEFEALPPGEAWVLVSAAGFADRGFPEVFAAGSTTRVRYALRRETIHETRIEGSRLLPAIPEADPTPQVSKFTITRADIDRTPGALEDVTRVVQQIPGVAADPDLLATFFVRGGGPEEVVFYLDGVPLTNPYHLGGFASIFNPMMIEMAEFYAGGIPARYEPALSGAFEVKYATGETKKVHVWADVSMLTAKIRADIPLGPEGLSATVSFRRSYFEAYFAVLKAFKLFGSNAVAPDITEGLLRVNYRRGNHNTTLSYIYAADGLDFVVKPGEQLLVNFQGGLKIANASHLAIFKHTVDLAGDNALELTAAYTNDRNSLSINCTRSSPDQPCQNTGGNIRSFANDAKREDGLVRLDFTWAHSEENRTRLGAQYAHRFLGLIGEVSDPRGVAPWSSLPFVETYVDSLTISPTIRRDLLSAYAEHTWRPNKVFSLEGGGRAQYDLTGSGLSGSARLAASVTLPTATVIKASGGVAAQPTLNPIYLDPTLGNPHLKPERSWTGIVGIEQPLPFEAFLKLEGWVKYLDQLVVNPDSQAQVQQLIGSGSPVFSSQGTGLAKGVDLLFLGRTRHFSYGASAALLFADRHNPLASGATDYPAPWDQRFTLAANVAWSPTDKWLFSARFNFRTGRPFTKVNEFIPATVRVDGQFQERYVPVFGETNAGRYPGFYEISVRGERRFRAGPLEMAIYAEVLNVTNSTNLFAEIYGTGNVATMTTPELTKFNHLPIRPFLGIRAEY